MAATSVSVLLLMLACLSGSSYAIDLDGNGYKNVLVAINPTVTENPLLIEKIKDMLIKGSTFLHTATMQKFYLKEVTILVPPDWKKGNYPRAKTEIYGKANIFINKPNRAYGHNPYTLQYGQCGEPGRYIHFTPKFMLDDTFIEQYGPRERVFVHEWAHLRWGVYDEYDEEKPFYIHGKLEATRCSKDIEGDIKKLSNPSLDCETDSEGLPTEDCAFFPKKKQNSTASIMYLQSLNSVNNFCTKQTHNIRAPNMQNKICGDRGAEEVIASLSIDSEVYDPLPSIPSPPPPPEITVVQRQRRVVCLVLDVSGSMQGSRILRQRQAATLFIENVIEDQAYVGIVTFTSTADITKPLTKIEGEASRKALVDALPKSASGGTQVCLGLEKALEELGRDGDTSGDEIIFLSDGESNSPMDCLRDVINSNTIVNTIAFGPNADKQLEMMATVSGGVFLYAEEGVDMTALLDVFASFTTSDGNLTKQTIQLESSGSKINGGGWLNGSVSIDRTVGNNTSFLVLYETNPVDILVVSPNADRFNTSSFKHDGSAKTFKLDIPGTAKLGKWTYSLRNLQSSPQSISMTVTSQAVSADIAPVMVKPHISQLSSNGSKPLVVYAEVSQGGVPVILAVVKATLVSESGTQNALDLLDNGAGADAIRHDGIYSRYFMPKESGRYSLKVKVENGDGKARFSFKRHSGALYIPGYVEDDGSVALNPPKPPISEEDQHADVGSFTRTAIGESFSVTIDPNVSPPKFPPNKITDLRADIQNDTILLTWTAPGEDFDEGTAKAYEIRFSEDPELLRSNFSDAEAVNVSSLEPQKSGSLEQYSFDADIKNGTTLFFAATAEDGDTLSSEISNFAQVTKFVPKAPKPPLPPPGPDGVNIMAIIVAVSTVTLVACLVASVTMCAMKRKRAIRA